MPETTFELLMVFLYMLALMAAGPFIFAWYWIENNILQPITVPPDYYAFVDERHLGGIPYIGDVLSNGAFVLAAIWGAIAIFRARDRLALKPGLCTGLILFFTSVFLVTFGSGYFHLDPGPHRIFLDRLPISLAAGAILGILLIDHGSKTQSGAYLTLAATMAFALAGLWHVTETGDLRLYALTQAAPLILALIFATTWNGCQHMIPGKRLLALAALYAAAKAAEIYDGEVFAQIELLSGHNLKHLLAAGAAAMLAPVRSHS